MRPLAAALLAGWPLAACAPAPEPTEVAVPAPAPEAASGPRAPAAASPAPPPAAPDRRCAQPARALIESAYARYRPQSEPGPLEEATCWTVDVATQLAALRARSEFGGLLGFDPLVDAQDAGVTALHIEQVDAASYAVRFDNLGSPTAVTWELVEEPGAPGTYRVGDLHTDAWRLTELLARGLHVAP